MEDQKIITPPRPLLHEELDSPIDYIESLRNYMEWMRLYSKEVAVDLLYAEQCMNTSLIQLYDESATNFDSSDVENLEKISQEIGLLRKRIEKNKRDAWQARRDQISKLYKQLDEAAEVIFDANAEDAEVDDSIQDAPKINYFKHLRDYHLWSARDYIGALWQQGGDFGGELVEELHMSEHEDDVAFLQDPDFPETNRTPHTHKEYSSGS